MSTDPSRPWFVGLEQNQMHYAAITNPLNLVIVASDPRELTVAHRDHVQDGPRYLISQRALQQVVEPRWLFETAANAISSKLAARAS